MDITSTRIGKYARVSVSGEVDATTSGQLQSALTDLLNDGIDDFTLDLSAVTFLSSSALSVLLQVRKVARTVRIEPGNRLVQRILELTELTSLFNEEQTGDEVPTKEGMQRPVTR
jgi:anti-sigma B factor antagonist